MPVVYVFCSGSCLLGQDFSRLILTFACMRFNVSGFMLRSLIHLEMSFVRGDEYETICILLHADIQLDQHYLLKMFSFFPLYGYAFLVKNQDSVGIWVYFRVFCSIPLIILSICLPIPCSFYYYCSVVELEIRDGASVRSYFMV